MQIGRFAPYLQPPVFTTSEAGPAATRKDASADFAAALSSVTQSTATRVDDARRYAPRADSSLSHLTPSDRQLLAAATGYNVSSDGVVQNPGREPVHPLIANMAFDRETGKLQGEVTHSYLSDMFGKYRDDPVVGGSFTDEILNRAFDFLAAGGSRRADEGPVRSMDARL